MQPSSTCCFALGIYRPEVPYSFEYLIWLGDKIERDFDVVSIYTTWGDREQDRFPATLLSEVTGYGAIPMVTWEPWQVPPRELFSGDEPHPFSRTVVDLGN